MTAVPIIGPNFVPEPPIITAIRNIIDKFNSNVVLEINWFWKANNPPPNPAKNAEIENASTFQFRTLIPNTSEATSLFHN